MDIPCVLCVCVRKREGGREAAGDRQTEWERGREEETGEKRDGEIQIDGYLYQKQAQYTQTNGCGFSAAKNQNTNKHPHW